VAIIRLEGLSLFGHHGANAPERTAGNRLDVDVEMELDTTQAEHTDRLRYTVNYDEIFAVVRDRVENDSFHLLEALAGDIAHAVLAAFGGERVRVRLTKLNLGWPSGGKAIIEVERRRGASRAPQREGSPRRRTAAGKAARRKSAGGGAGRGRQRPGGRARPTRGGK
jgi:7,8-dihydroneopterin aldolase/epimerase/oxygenase